MNFIREILRLNDELHLSQREIAKAVNKSRDAVSNVMKMAKAQKLDYSKVKTMKDDELKDLIYPNSNPYIDTNINPYSIIPEISPKTRPTGTILTEKGYDEVYIKFKKNWYIQYSNMKNYLNNEGWGYYAKYYKWK